MKLIIKGYNEKIKVNYNKGKINSPILIILYFNFKFNKKKNENFIKKIFSFFTKLNFGILSIPLDFKISKNNKFKFIYNYNKIINLNLIFDWMQGIHMYSKQKWIIGHSYTNWILANLLTRRPEITKYILISPQTNIYDFKVLFLILIPGLIISGTKDKLIPIKYNIKFEILIKKSLNKFLIHKIILDANHFFEGKISNLIKECVKFLYKNENFCL